VQVKRVKKELEFFVAPSPPFRLDLTVWTLRRNPANLIDRWDGRTYRRVLRLSTGPAEIAVEQTGPPDAARLKVAVCGGKPGPRTKAEVAATLDRMLGLHVDLRGFYRLSSGDRQLKLLADPFCGMRPPRYETLFESVITAIASQQVSRTVSILLLNRLAHRFGVALSADAEAVHAFPAPRDVAGLGISELRQLGFNRQKGRAIIELASAITDGTLDLEGVAALSDEEAVARLSALRGIGRWSAEYVLLRGLGRIHIFPGDDVGAQKNLQRWLHLGKPPEYAAVQRILHRWHPYAGLIYFHMLLDRLADAGYL
jgi:DNA-3-methyladenine glycosylase II